MSKRVSLERPFFSAPLGFSGAFSATYPAGHGEICHRGDQPTTRRFTWTWGLFKENHTRNPCGSACCGLAGLRFAMWITRVGGKFRYGLLEKSLIFQTLRGRRRNGLSETPFWTTVSPHDVFSAPLAHPHIICPPVCACNPMSRFNQKNPRAHKNKIGTPPPPQTPLKKGEFYGHMVFPAERTHFFQVSIKLAHPFPAPELRTRILRTLRGFF